MLVQQAPPSVNTDNFAALTLKESGNKASSANITAGLSPVSRHLVL